MPRRSLMLGLLPVVALVSACTDFDTSREVPKRGSLGEEVYGVLCDRISAQALHEDITGASFTAVCHKTKGVYADTVDQKTLPEAAPDAVDRNGKPVSVEQQKANRKVAVTRIEALARRRGDLIKALNATFPNVAVSVKDLANPNPAKSCDAVTGKGAERGLHGELADMLGRLQDLYNDGTIPDSTRSLGSLMNSFKASPDAQAVLARLEARQGYRPNAVGLGAVKPILAYPRMRDLSNATLSLLSADSNPYGRDAKTDELGNRVPVPGAAYPQFSRLLEVAHDELANAKADPKAALLGITQDPVTGREILSRPREGLEVMTELLLAEDPAYGGGRAKYIVKRDPRGYAKVALVDGKVPAPFVDKNADLLADVDDLGRFVTATGAVPPTPFFTPGAPAAPAGSVARDSFGRAMGGNSAPIHEYIDTGKTFGASMLANMKPLVNPDPAKKHETLMYAAAGAQVLTGKENPALLDLVYALGQILGDKSTDDTLAYARTLFTTNLPDVTRMTGVALGIGDIASNHPEAKIPKTSVFWDQLLEVIVKLAKEPGLLEDILRALGEEDSQALGGVLSSYMKFGDRISYNRDDLNGPVVNLTTSSSDPMKTPVDRSKPDAGFNRSAFHRFSKLVSEASGVAACNKDKAVLHGKGIPIVGSLDLPLLGQTFKECEVMKIDDLAIFYLDSIIGKSKLFFRPGILRDGVLGIGKATVDTIEQSGGINGFWDGPKTSIFRPKPEFINRLVLFDLEKDSPQKGGKNFLTNNFIKDLIGSKVGSSVCPERIIDDPEPKAADASPDGKVHGLRSCQEGDWLPQRGPDILYVLENFGFYKAITPLVTAFANHKREDLFVQLLTVVARHWPDDKGPATECQMGSDPKNTCTKDGLVTYEPLLAEALGGDAFPALVSLVNVLKATTVKHCDAIDPQSKACTKSTEKDGIAVLSQAARALVDPEYAQTQNLKDRTGKTTALRNDGTEVEQVTPIYLLANALAGVDKAFDAYGVAHPEDKDRQAQFRLARSQLVDQFLAVSGSGRDATYVNPAMPKVVPKLIDLLRAQLFAHCPTSFTAPFDRCAWTKEELPKKLDEILRGPTFAATVDLMDAIRKNDAARTELESFLTYMFDTGSPDDAFAAILASSSDMVQVLQDDANLIPLFHVLAEATAPSVKDKKGRVVSKSLIDAQAALLARLGGKAFNKDGAELCSEEVDPHQVVTLMLTNLVTPMVADDGQPGETPLGIFMDVAADLNRTAPGDAQKLEARDYASISDNVSDFLLNKERGLEQFYAIVRNATAPSE